MRLKHGGHCSAHLALEQFGAGNTSADYRVDQRQLQGLIRLAGRHFLGDSLNGLSPNPDPTPPSIRSDESAKQRLDNSQMPVTSIGYEVGFKDPSYFARAFKQFTGCTPSEYRQAHRTTPPQDEPQDEQLSQVIDSLPERIEL